MQQRDDLDRLIPRIREGETSAFEQLFRELHAPLCEVVDGFVRSQAVAEEIVQDLFFVLWMKRQQLETTGSLRGYLFTAARHRALHHLRHQAVSRRLSRSEAAHEVATFGMARPPSLPDETLETRESNRAVRAAIDGLPQRSRLALVLRLDHAMSYADVALAMGISVKGVEKLIAIAMRRLRVVLGGHLPAEPDPRRGGDRPG